MLTPEALGTLVESGEIDTVVVAPPPTCRAGWMGKRMHGEFFREEALAAHPIEGCNPSPRVDMEMDPVPGYESRQLGT